MLRADGEGKGGGVEGADQDLREQVLGGVLLHVVVAAREVEAQAEFARAGVPVEHVDDVVAFGLQGEQGQAVDRALVGGLAAALGAEYRAFKAEIIMPVAEFLVCDPCRDLPAVGVGMIYFFGHFTAGRGVIARLPFIVGLPVLSFQPTHS